MITGRPPTFLPFGRKTWRWLNEEGPRIQGVTLRSRIAWQALWTEVNWSITQRLLVQSAAPEPVDPIFIVGPWRSGTTVMHECMVAATGLPTTQTWQCMNAASFMLSGKTVSATSIQRPMDRLTVHAESPQEDEFALLTLGVESAYRAFLSPSRLLSLIDTLNPQRWLEDARWIDTWVPFLRACLSFAPDRSLPLLLKSPNHTFRIRSILRRFPAARFVWMDRQPDSVFHSNLKMWASMCEHYGFDKLQRTSLDAFLIHAFDRLSETLSWCSLHLGRHQFVVLDTRDFENAPIETLRRVCHRIGLAHHYREEPLRQCLKAVPPRFPNEYATSLSGSAQDALSRLRQACEPARHSHGALTGNL